MTQQDNERLINETHKHGIEIKRRIAAMLATIAHLTRIARALALLNSRRRRVLELEKASRAATAPLYVTMFDSISVSEIPKNAEAVAGYVGGYWPTFEELVKRFPRAHKLSIAVNSHEDADCLDVEKGDATPQDVPGWYMRQRLKGKKLPCFYASLSVMPEVVKELHDHGINRNAVRLWVAHWTNEPHIPVGYDACQWTDQALNRNLDASLCFVKFFQ